MAYNIIISICFLALISSKFLFFINILMNMVSLVYVKLEGIYGYVKSFLVFSYPHILAFDNQMR